MSGIILVAAMSSGQCCIAQPTYHSQAEKGLPATENCGHSLHCAFGIRNLSLFVVTHSRRICLLPLPLMYDLVGDEFSLEEGLHPCAEQFAPLVLLTAVTCSFAPRRVWRVSFPPTFTKRRTSDSAGEAVSSGVSALRTGFYNSWCPLRESSNSHPGND